MKTLFSTIVVLGLAFNLSLAEPNELSLAEASRVEVTDQKVKVSLQEGAGKLAIKIMSPKGKLLHAQKLNVKEALIVPFDLSELPEGEYQFKIENEEEVATYTVNSKAPLPKTLPLMAYGKKVDYNTIRLLVVGLEEPGVTVNIRSQNGKLIQSDQVDQPEGFSRDYTFKHLKTSEIYLEVVDTQGRTKNIYF
ncbi:hypothetical protein [Pararhodonellum marinum]|uniref:hypothetical protein n=1 Tax=Pararhodonellum marinum TaxID=2755358 RepID=UPI001E31CCCC|nr:hypothetical protein [Pararhodonellum marinum]